MEWTTGLACTGMNWQTISQHPGISAVARRPRFGKVVAATAGVAVVGAGVYLTTAPRYYNSQAKPDRLKIPRPVMEAFFGAVGEIAQVAVLYPLDTIKVRCQATGCSVGSVVKDLLGGGLNIRVFQQLYAGVVSASICSVAIGSLYYVSFCMSKRFAHRIFAESQPVTPSPGLAQGHAAAAQSSISASHQTTVVSTVKVEGESNKLAVNLFAAVTAALVGALIESPVEMFKNQTKAGILSGNMLKNMAVTLKHGGLRSWYWGFLPFCFKSLPFDIGELLTYSQLRDWQQSLAVGPPTQAHLVASVPDGVWDAAIGAAAGAAAVLISMPADVIKTVMDTGGGAAGSTSGSLQQGASSFFATGNKLVAQRGPGVLFTGLWPRLGEKVPSTMFYWLAVETCRRTFAPLMEDEPENQQTVSVVV